MIAGGRRAVRRAVAVLALLFLALAGWRFLAARGAVPARTAHTQERPAAEPSPDVSAAPAAAAAAAAVRGRVRNVRGEAIEGATVALVDDARAVHAREALASEGRITSSDASGVFEVTWPVALSAGALSVRHRSYVAKTLALTAVPAEPIEIVMEEGQRLAGDVVFLDKTTAVAGVRVVARGVAAPYAAAREDSVPPAVAAFQEAVTDERGGFELDGLPAGWYQVDVVAPGLAVVPDGTAVLPPFLGDPRYLQELVLLGPRGVVARTGDGPLRIVVASISSIAVRVVDAATGHAIPGAYASLYVPDGFERLMRSPVSNNSEVMLVNGRYYSIHEADLPQGTEARFVLSRSHVTGPGARCRVTAAAPDYEKRETDAPITPLGAVDTIPIYEIALSGPEKRGGVRFHLRDRNGVPVCHACALVLQRAWGRETVATFRFDVHGNGDPVALAVGDYAIRAAARPESMPLDPAEATVSEGAVSDVTLTLRDWGGFALTVVDAEGQPVDDFGVTATVGHEPVKEGVSEEGDRTVIRGKFPTLVPGLGASWRGQLVGYPEGPVTIEVVRNGYRPCHILTDARAGEIVPVRAVLEADPGAPWESR